MLRIIEATPVCAQSSTRNRDVVTSTVVAFRIQAAIRLRNGRRYVAVAASTGAGVSRRRLWPPCHQAFDVQWFGTSHIRHFNF